MSSTPNFRNCLPHKPSRFTEFIEEGPEGSSSGIQDLLCWSGLFLPWPQYTEALMISQPNNTLIYKIIVKQVSLWMCWLWNKIWFIYNMSIMLTCDHHPQPLYPSIQSLWAPWPSSWRRGSCPIGQFWVCVLHPCAMVQWWLRIQNIPWVIESLWHDRLYRHKLLMKQPLSTSLITQLQDSPEQFFVDHGANNMNL